ncbi:MAG: HAD-IC family P-type ATPase, partial [Oscillospiraceae bacterium]|nr:HAD-IC family P-type ATPase [Oscillospiraceae bacterium]
MKQHYLEEAQNVLSELRSSPEGLSSAEAASRLEQNGKNKLEEAEKESTLKRFLNLLADPMILMLIVAAVIQAAVTVLEGHGSLRASDFIDVYVILAVVMLNAVMSLVQENKAEAAVAALMDMTAETSHAIRDGEVQTVRSEDLVVGDVLVFEAGDTIPADCRILESYSMKVEEAALTGESVPVNKIVDILMCEEGKTVPLGDRKNMLYSGSTVVFGRGKAVVTATGSDTEMGRIAKALSMASQDQVPLQKKMSELSAFLTKLVLLICLVVFIVGLVQAMILGGQAFSWTLLGNSVISSFIAAIALAVAAIPEGLPAVVTIVLSIGVTDMAKHKALMRKLSAVETLGCTQIICSDKTGTLTQNKMTVVEEFTFDQKLMATAMALCNDATIKPGEQFSEGEPTEAALVNFAASIGLMKYELEAEAPRIAEAPFDSMRKMMSTVHETKDGIVQYTKGAADMVLKHCSSYWKDGAVVPMTEEFREEIRKTNKAFADKALRVLSAAFRPLDARPASEDPEELEHDLIFLGLYGMIDPCREEVFDAIHRCKEAGIRPVMITGDHKDTAVAIGRQLNILDRPEQAIVGAELDNYSDEELVELVPQYSVYARVQPEHKTRIVNAWRARDMVTAMTGDGVNDAPSIKAADIGIGMGITGTAVTKSAADMVLADDNFATIVRAVEEGRKIYDNICKVLQFQLSTNLAEVLIVFFASILNFRILSPVHLLWINMVTDTLPGLALGVEKAEGDLMRRKPRTAGESIFAG